MLMGMSPDVGASPGGLAAYMRQVRADGRVCVCVREGVGSGLGTHGGRCAAYAHAVGSLCACSCRGGGAGRGERQSFLLPTRVLSGLVLVPREAVRIESPPTTTTRAMARPPFPSRPRRAAGRGDAAPALGRPRRRHDTARDAAAVGSSRQGRAHRPFSESLLSRPSAGWEHGPGRASAHTALGPLDTDFFHCAHFTWLAVCFIPGPVRGLPATKHLAASDSFCRPQRAP